LYLAAGVLGLLVYVLAVGWLFEVVRLAAVRLPALVTVEQLSLGRLFGQGLTSVALMLVVVAVGGGLAYFSSHRNWDVHGQDWHDIVQRGVTKAAADDAAKQQRGRRERRHAEMIAARAARAEGRLRRVKLDFIAGAPAKVQARAKHRAQGLPEGEPAKLAAAPLGDWAVRVVAGFNIMLIAGLIAVVVAREIGELVAARPWAPLAQWVGVLIGVGVFLLARWVLTIFSPLRLPARLHGLLWGLVAVAALFASAPLGVLVLTGVGIATAGRALARVSPPKTAAQCVRSPVLWSLLGICTLLGAAYSATPPVTFSQAEIGTPSGGELTGGYIARSDAGVYMVTCVALADATSADVRLQLIPSSQVRSVRIAGALDYLDSGERPSIARLALHALGLGADPPTLFSAALRARHPTCANAGPRRLADGVLDPSLGTGVIAQSPGVTRRVTTDEAPIQADGKTPPATASLARRYQPTLLVTAADRNWPVSVNSVLAERGPGGQPVCLVRRSGPRICPPTARELTSAGATSSDYLQLPVALGQDRSPAGQFQAFLRGQYQSSGPLDQWLADPSRLDPWSTAQIYFYDAGPIKSSDWPARPLDPSVPSGLLAFEYWFYYPYNYYPIVVDSSLMNEAPLAGDQSNIDLHQGDWEHVDVLLNPKSMQPEWLYMARHSTEGQFIPWSSPSLRFDGTHPVIQAAFGGHPSYLPGCGAAPRVVTLDTSNDWLSCGSGRFAFRAATTPLVNIAVQPWACWPGYFGEATKLEVSNARNKTEAFIDSIEHALYVAGPRAPLQQAENKNIGACH
jgi:hypothetical protein